MKKIGIRYLRVEEVYTNVDFDDIYNRLVQEHDGIFIDSFSDNVETYMKEWYGIDLGVDFDIIDLAEINGDAANDIYQEWQNYLEERNNETN